MGNITSDTIQVDYGQLETFGMLYKDAEYNPEVVKRYIIERRLCPFYKGQETEQEFYMNIKELDRPQRKSSVLKLSLQSLQKSQSLVDRESSTSIQDLLEEPIECPICFLFYPRNINFSRCCDQPICTDCFLQIKRPETNYEPASCPYCVQPHFGILYYPVNSEEYNQRFGIDIPPQSALNSQRRKSFSHTNEMVLTSDSIRPDWEQKKALAERKKMQEQQRIALAHARRRQMEFLTSAQLTQQSSGRAVTYMQAMQVLGADIEEMMMMEAIRRSMVDATPPPALQEERLTPDEQTMIELANQMESHGVSDPES